MLGALGVVYGDIGTSPLYTIKECFAGTHGVPVDPANVVGVLSLIVWTIALIVCVKYVLFVLRADNRGEGGILAMLALAITGTGQQSRRRAIMLALGVFGAALLYGDGIITPCITVMGALEGLNVATNLFEPYVVPMSVGVMLVLFLFQRHGTGRVGSVLGPVMLLWFLTLAVLGVRGIVMQPQVLQALLPWHAVGFVAHHGTTSFLVIGTVFLAVTGAEALYADLGHFGRRPIQWAWFGVACPALLLNYLGQGGLLLRDPTTIENPFFKLVPAFGLYPLVALSVLASVIASQALITGTFSITMQAIQLGFLPRLEIRHTSENERGQIYMPHVNWILMVCCITTCIGFGSSSALASAYGIAVTLTMLITTVLFYFAARRVLGWSRPRAVVTCCVFGLFELVFFLANALKVAHGGWFPLMVGAGIVVVMFTWKTGRALLYQRNSTAMLSMDAFLQSLQEHPIHRVPGTAVYMAGSASGTPLALLHNLKHNKVLHENLLLVTIQSAEEPRVSREDRLRVERMPGGINRLVAVYGFMERPRVLELLKLWKQHEPEFRISDTTFFLSRETIVPAKRRSMSLWRTVLFAFLQRNAQPATAFFGLPLNRVVELGVQVEL
ncbi:MAG: potassium transporter Kup [Planctomycetes bacterium]|nr:potassium transporter Kup [Planctomycetota bacterium]